MDYRFCQQVEVWAQRVRSVDDADGVLALARELGAKKQFLETLRGNLSRHERDLDEVLGLYYDSLDFLELALEEPSDRLITEAINLAFDARDLSVELCRKSWQLVA